MLDNAVRLSFGVTPTPSHPTPTPTTLRKRTRFFRSGTRAQELGGTAVTAEQGHKADRGGRGRGVEPQGVEPSAGTIW